MTLGRERRTAGVGPGVILDILDALECRKRGEAVIQPPLLSIAARHPAHACVSLAVRIVRNGTWYGFHSAVLVHCPLTPRARA